MLNFISAFLTLLVSFCLTVNSLCISSDNKILDLLQANNSNKCQFDASYTICDRQESGHFDVYSIEISIHAITKESYQLLSDFEYVSKNNTLFMSRTDFIPRGLEPSEYSYNSSYEFLQETYSISIIGALNLPQELSITLSAILPFTSYLSNEMQLKKSGGEAQFCKHLEWPQVGKWSLNKTLCPDMNCTREGFEQSKWYYVPNQCVASFITPESFIKQANIYNLRKILFIGTSRTRGEFYDLCLLLGSNVSDLQPHKSHNNLNFTSQSGIEIHSHWFDCREDVHRHRLNGGYSNTLKLLNLHFKELGICNGSQGLDSSSNEYRELNLASNETSRYAVILSSGICESDCASILDYEWYFNVMLKQVYNSCNPQYWDFKNNKTAYDTSNPFIVKSEESVARRYRLYNSVTRAFSEMKRSIDGLSSEIGMKVNHLDSFHLTRSAVTDQDNIHYSDGSFQGSIVSKTITRQIMFALDTIMKNETQRNNKHY
jgi:hypothetical protein